VQNPRFFGLIYSVTDLTDCIETLQDEFDLRHLRNGRCGNPVPAVNRQGSPSPRPCSTVRSCYCSMSLLPPSILAQRSSCAARFAGWRARRSGLLARYSAESVTADQ
jgi:hypothetical protein